MTQRYESLRNGTIGTVVSENENEVVLDFNGKLKTIKRSNLKTWYKPLSFVDPEEVAFVTERGENMAKIMARLNKPDQPNGDVPPKPDCTPIIQKLLNYLDARDCVYKVTKYYIRVRLKYSPGNIMEIHPTKYMKSFRIILRSEAIIHNEKLFKMGKVSPLKNFYALDFTIGVNGYTDITELYAIADAVIKYESEHKTKFNRGVRKKGTGRINGYNTLAYKRDLFGIKDDIEMQELIDKTNDLVKQTNIEPPVTFFDGEIPFREDPTTSP
jgi:hypothetical protein